MNFKDAYKNMNDEIHGDRALLHSILNGEVEKKKKFDFNFKPVFATALTAVFVLCIATVYKNTGIEQYSPSNVNVTTEKKNEEMLTTGQKEEKTNESTDQFSVSDNPQNNISEVKVPKKSQINNPNTTGVESVVEKDSDYDEPASADESNAPMVASLNETMHLETGLAYPGDETFDESYDGFDSEEIDSTPAPVKAYDMSQEACEESEPKKKIAASGGGASVKAVDFDSVLSSAAIPDDMTFGKGVRNSDASISYVAVSKENPDRRLTIVMSETDNPEAAYPGAHCIRTISGSIAVIAENISDYEIKEIIDSLTD